MQYEGFINIRSNFLKFIYSFLNIILTLQHFSTVVSQSWGTRKGYNLRLLALDKP